MILPMFLKIQSLFSVWSGVLSVKQLWYLSIHRLASECEKWMPRCCNDETKSRVCKYWYPFELRKTDSRNAWLMSVCLSTILPRINTVYIYSNFIVNFVQCRFHLSIFITEVTLCFLWGYRLEDICKCFWSPPQLHRLSVAGLRRSPASGGSAPQLRLS